MCDDCANHKRLFSDAERKEIYLNCLIMYGTLNTQHALGVTGAIVGMALAIGTIDGRPLTVADVADMTTMSRRTVKRIIEKNIAKGFVEPVKIGGQTRYKVMPKAVCMAQGLLNKIYQARRETIDQQTVGLSCMPQFK